MIEKKMGNMSGNELDVVRALSEVELPPDMVEFSRIGELVKNLNQSKEKLQKSKSELEKLRQDREKGNFFSNWWDDVDDQIHDASLDISRQLVDVNRHAAQLLVINTALSKMLNSQQQVLLEQQGALDKQAEQIARQNLALHEYQQDFRTQQGEISQANQKLLDAHDVSLRLAGELMQRLDQVAESERRVNAAHEILLENIERHFGEAMAQADISSEEAMTERLMQFESTQRAETAALIQRSKTASVWAIGIATTGLVAGVAALAIQIFQ
ncbi:hypothetical protein [Achromobacter insuavis]|nr:hypothetical protein [Achromobacter insuavis]